MSFDKLPAEVRLQIYQDLFTFETPISIQLLNENTHRWVWQALEVNQEFRNEGARALFSRNTFRLDIFTQCRFVDLLQRAKRAEFVSLPRLSHWPAGREVEYSVAVPLPESGKVRALRSIQVSNSIFQPPINTGWEGSPDDYSVIRPGNAYQFTETELPHHSWDARSLIRRIQIAAPKSVGRLWWEEVELACRLTELLTTEYFPNLTYVELDMTAPMDHHGSLGVPMPLEPLKTLFVVKASRLEVVGRQRRDLDRALAQRIKQAAQIKGGLRPLDENFDFDM